MDDILTAGSTSKAVDRCDENGLGEDERVGERQSRVFSVVWVHPGCGASITAQRSCDCTGSDTSPDDTAKGPPPMGDVQNGDNHIYIQQHIVDVY